MQQEPNVLNRFNKTSFRLFEISDFWPMCTCIFIVLNGNAYHMVSYGKISTAVMSVSTHVNDLFVEGGLVVLVNRSMLALWLLALPMDCVLGEAEGVCIPISFRRWFYTNTGKTFTENIKTGLFGLIIFVIDTAEQDSTEHFLQLCSVKSDRLQQAAVFSFFLTSLLRFELWEAFPVLGNYTLFLFSDVSRITQQLVF